MVKVKELSKKRKAPSAPSFSKTLKAYKPKKQKAKPVINQENNVTKLDKKKQAATAKAVKKSASRKWGADPKRDNALHLTYMEYLKLNHPARWGNGELDADSKGMDGKDTLRLLPYVAKDTGIKSKRIIEILQDKPGSKLIESVIKCSVYNMWQWANFCSRLWVETQAMDPPVRRIVNIDFSQIFPGSENPGILDIYVNLIKTNSEAMQALRNLGLMRFKVRLIFTIKDDYSVSAKTLYKLFDLLQFPSSEKSIWGISVDINKSTDFQKYPREIVILRPIDLRKSSEITNHLDAAADAGYRTILPFDLIKGNYTKLKEIKDSSIYSMFLKTWKGLSPLLTMPMDSKMVKVAKVSKISDILLV